MRMEAEAIGSTASAICAAGDFLLDPVCRFIAPVRLAEANTITGSKVEGWVGGGVRNSSLTAHDSSGDPYGEGRRDNARAESGESAVKPDPKDPCGLEGFVWVQTQ